MFYDYYGANGLILVSQPQLFPCVFLGMSLKTRVLGMSSVELTSHCIRPGVISPPGLASLSFAEGAGTFRCNEVTLSVLQLENFLSRRIKCLELASVFIGNVPAVFDLSSLFSQVSCHKPQ